MDRIPPGLTSTELIDELRKWPDRTPVKVTIVGTNGLEVSLTADKLRVEAGEGYAVVVGYLELPAPPPV